jgi:PglZ domain
MAWKSSLRSNLFARLDGIIKLGKDCLKIKDYITEEVFRPRMKRAGALVVYDPDGRYRDLIIDMKDEGVEVVDASESSVESREAALDAFLAFGGDDGSVRNLLVYVPTAQPRTDEDRQKDPFSIYAVCGSVFPDGDGDGFQSLCLKAKPDQATELRRIFADNPNPSFSTIDNVGGGTGWPELSSTLDRKGPREILYSLLVPTEIQNDRLAEANAWVGETRDFLKRTLGLSLKTRAKSWEPIADELWRFLLFSEFSFDLPQDVPASLTNVPSALDEARPIVEELCDRLRNDRSAQPIYIERAEAIEKELSLPGACADIKNLGSRDTFPFEEQSFFSQAVESIDAGDYESARETIYVHANTVWVGKGESQAKWGLVGAALLLLESCEDYSRQLPGHIQSQNTLLDFYLESLREVDRLQREFEQAVGDLLEIESLLAPVVSKAKDSYRKLVEKVQTVFTKHLEASGWPPTERLANADVFDRYVAPKLQDSGRRVAYILVDALRYELGVELHKQLEEDDIVELHAAYAQLPTITIVGMASLLPGAGQELALSKNGEGFVPVLGDQPVSNVQQRMNVLRKRYGDRFAEMRLAEYTGGNPRIKKTVELLVLRSVEIDSHFENNPETAPNQIHDTLKRIRLGINKLRKAGFNDVVIVTDHGFFMNTQAEAGDVCTKPPGTWVSVHERIVIGNGSADSHNFVMSAEKAGVRGDFNQIGAPRTMAPYRSGMLYFHGGASLQEAVVPVITAKLSSGGVSHEEKIEVLLSYKNGAEKITTRLPVVDLELKELETTDMFASPELEVLLEAQDESGEVVGEAKPGGSVNAATGTIMLKPGKRVQVAVKMQLQYEGKFSVKVLDPKTLMTYSTLALRTDYL